ncbi:hypothetical protein K1X76_00465 [bacterium]|nr:hypothetical protein [bacterium]
MQTLEFTKNPSLTKNFAKALFLPRKGFGPKPELPALKGVFNAIKINPALLHSYFDVCQFNNKNDVPLLFPHNLASSVHMALLTHKSFPLKLLGAVHLRNQITRHAPVSTADNLRLETAFTEVRVTSKGVEFDFYTEFFSNENLVWEEVTTYYKRGRFGADSGKETKTMETLTDTVEVARWYLSKKLGKQYAKLSNDYNPIHISKTLAKMFGFKRDVAHGMGVLATAIDRAGLANAKTNDVFFKGPLFLENEVRLVQGTTDKSRFDIYCGNNPKPSICFRLV